MTYPDGIDALINVNADQTLAAGGHAARHNSTNTALAEVRDWLAAPTQSVQASDYTFTANDVYRLTVMTGGSAVTIPPASSVDWDAGTQLAVLNQGSATVTVTAGSGVTLNGSGTALAQYAGGVAVRTGSDEFTFVPFSGAGSASPSAPSSVEYLVIAGGGGGGGGSFDKGGGGGGGYRCSVSGENSGGDASAESPFSVVAGTSYTVTVGGGGSTGANGSNSVFGSITSTGGGTGGHSTSQNGSAGGSGGGASNASPGTAVGGNGTTSQGFKGGNATGTSGLNGAAGGGGAGGAASNMTSSNGTNGGNGVSSSITGTSVARGGGGGGGGGSAGGGTTGGTGTAGGGNGGYASVSNGTAGTANTGGGGGGAANLASAAGGSGVVIIRHNRLNATATTTGSPTVSTQGEYTLYVFNASGTIEWAA
jgi:hypothetical protein